MVVYNLSLSAMSLWMFYEVLRRWDAPRLTAAVCRVGVHERVRLLVRGGGPV